jgi:hypothetical protein
MIFSHTKQYFLLLALAISPLVAKDVILEFKGAYFLSTDCNFKNIYDKGGALYGPELTFQLKDSCNWYGFLSVDRLKKDGCSIGLANPTTVRLLPLGIGLKYFMPDCWDCADFYLGLGLQPVHVSTQDCSAFVNPQLSQWGVGGIAKAGIFINLCSNFVLDLFIDYSFVKTNCKPECCSHVATEPIKADLSGAVFGAGIGYRF